MSKASVEYLRIYCPTDDERYTMDTSDINVYFYITGDIGHNAGHGEKGIVIDCQCGDQHKIVFNSW